MQVLHAMALLLMAGVIGCIMVMGLTLTLLKLLKELAIESRTTIQQSTRLPNNTTG